MTTKTEGKHPWEFVLWENGGTLSRERGTLASGQNLVAGTVLEKVDPANPSSELQAFNGSQDSGGGADPDACGILGDAVDASSGAKACAYLAREAEVNWNQITFPAGHEQNTKDSLAKLHIIARDEI